jgi:hypothetical protein
MEDRMEILGDVEKLSGLSTDLLKKLFQDQMEWREKRMLDFFPKYIKGYLEINGCYIRKEIEIDFEKPLDKERFEPHPYIPIQASNYGNIKYSGMILEKKEHKEGYIYVNVPYEIDRLKNEQKENKRSENKLATPTVEDVVEYENEIYPINKQEMWWPWHPCICIGVTDDSKIINLHKYFGKMFKEKINNGIKFVEITIYVYRLVAETWLGNPDYDKYKFVHHITNNGNDNSIYNLMWVTSSQHAILENR